tara:strand:- start:23620 stop:24276 length:657 start_codon:yes stop_codon:yes gene_type:complete
MEKSIENIWKEGVLKGDALVDPKINNLYSQKSIHIFDAFKRMFKINLIAVVAFAFIFLIIRYFNGIPITGILFFITIMVLVFVNKKLLNGLETIETGASSYQYLKAFNHWIKEQVTVNKRLARFLYPMFFMTIILGFWFVDGEGMPLGKRLFGQVLYGFPDVYLLFGVPVLAICVITISVILLAFFGDRIYVWDVNIVYGRIFRKLEELMTEIEELKK